MKNADKLDKNNFIGSGLRAQGSEGFAPAPSPQPPAGSQRPFVTVIVPVYNGADTIDACVQSLLAQQYPSGRFEVLIVNNGSSDDTARRVRQYPVLLMHERRKRSSYAARNFGVQAAHGELIAFTDSDCVARPDWLQQLVAGFEDPSMAGFAGFVDSVKSETVLEAFAHQRKQVSQEASMNCGFLPYAITANVAYRREALKALNGFDESIISGGDADFSWRLQQQLGKIIRFNRDAVVSHKHRGTLKGLWRQHRLYGFGTAMLYERYPGYRKSTGFEFYFWIKRLVQFFIRGLFRLVSWPFTKRRSRLYVAEHFLEIVCTTARFCGILAYRAQGEGSNRVMNAQPGLAAVREAHAGR